MRSLCDNPGVLPRCWLVQMLGGYFSEAVSIANYL
jgi:hypothetical protein